VDTIFTYTKDAEAERLMEMHPIEDVKTRNRLIDYMICKHYRKIFYSVNAHINDIFLTEEILQETFLRTSSCFNSIKSLSSYVLYNNRTALNIARRSFLTRKKMDQCLVSIYKNDGSVNEEMLSSAGQRSPFEATELWEIKACVEGLISGLSSPDREIVVRRCIFCEPYNSIAKRFGLKPCTARSRFRRAKGKLYERLSRLYIGMEWR